MAAKAEKVFFYRPELQWAQDTVTATSIITPESIVAGAIGILAGAIDRRNQAADRLVETNRQKDVALCEAAAVIDARRFIDSNDLDNLFGLKKGDSCFGFLRECVSEIILSAAQKGRRFGGVLDRFAERLGVDKSIIEEAACGLQERENRSFMRESRGSHEQQAEDMRFLIRDLFHYLEKAVPVGEEVFPINKRKMNKWKRQWGFSVTTPSINNRQTVLWKKFPPKK